MASKQRVISDTDEIVECIMNEDSSDDELIESELSSEDDFELKDVNALWNKKKKQNTQIAK